MNRKILLGVALVLIVVAIIFFEPERVDSSDINVSAYFDNSDDKPQRVLDKELEFEYAPDIQGIQGYINTDENLSIRDLKGKVVLVDIWTFSCINCIRTLPYITGWDEKYKDDGLVIIGVHTPEFEFEKDIDNVRAAVDEHGINYPVVLDNNYQTWRAYKNRYWPRKYLIDADGFIRYDHIGEGAYEETEKVIQELLKEKNEIMGEDSQIDESTLDIEEYDIESATPEIYFGYEFTRGNFGSVEGFNPQQVTTYSLPDQLQPNKAYLEGSWFNHGDYSELRSDSGLVVLPFLAKKVNIVAGSNQTASVAVLLDNKFANQFAGDHVKSGFVDVKKETLYNVVSAGLPIQRTIVLNITTPGFRIYTFTFG